MPDELREKIAILYGKRRHGHSYQDPECRIESINFADSILSLIDGERCEWTWEGDISLYSTSCGDAWPLATPFTFCPRCGKRIEVKEVEDGQ